jgi:hypothetical protein
MHAATQQTLQGAKACSHRMLQCLVLYHTPHGWQRQYNPADRQTCCGVLVWSVNKMTPCIPYCTVGFHPGIFDTTPCRNPDCLQYHANAAYMLAGPTMLARPTSNAAQALCGAHSLNQSTPLLLQVLPVPTSMWGDELDQASIDMCAMSRQGRTSNSTAGIPLSQELLLQGSQQEKTCAPEKHSALHLCCVRYCGLHRRKRPTLLGSMHMETQPPMISTCWCTCGVRVQLQLTHTSPLMHEYDQPVTPLATAFTKSHDLP